MLRNQNLPYRKVLELGRKYEVYILHNVDGCSFKELSLKYGISVSAVRNDYDKAVCTIMRCYINHLTIKYGDNITRLWYDVEECYIDRVCTIAYFEKEFSDILCEYRAGEPGLPDEFLKTLPPYRREFSNKTISSIIRLRETNHMTFSRIGKRLRMTSAKAYKLYNCYYYLKFNDLADRIKNATGEEHIKGPYYSRHKIGCGKSIYDSLAKDYPDFVEPKKNVTKQLKQN